jgi:hypothetical protein
MPSHTAASALIELYNNASIPGAPWGWPTWQKITGVKKGLFPENDCDLPPGWTRQDALDIHSWFLLCKQTGNQTGHSEIGAAMPGKARWIRFIQSKWESWQIHDIIVMQLREQRVHPIQIVINEGSLTSWPKADGYVAAAMEHVGLAIFGSDSLGTEDIFPFAVRRCLGVFIQRSWTRIRERLQKDRGLLVDLEESALAAFKSTYAYRVDFSGAHSSQSSTKGRQPK